MKMGYTHITSDEVMEFRGCITGNVLLELNFEKAIRKNIHDSMQRKRIFFFKESNSNYISTQPLSPIIRAGHPRAKRQFLRY